MDSDALYHFFFETYDGIGLLILICLVVCVLLCFIMEHGMRKRFKGHDRPDGSWDIFDDEDDDGEGK